jgi:hypothetical protein
MEKTVKDTISIKIDNEPFTCFVMESGAVLIEEKISKFFSAEYGKGSVMMKYTGGARIEGKNVYPLSIVVSYLRLRILKQLAEDGFSYRVTKAIVDRDNPKERVLSEFDRMMLRAVHYNPKEQGI